VASAALTMFCFGLGTLPSMLATGFAAGWIQRLRQHRYFRQAAGLMLIGFGGWTATAPHLMLH
jgi:sulfite exporter TauE/SafE